MQKINWFIGHMAKSLKQIQSEIKGIDLIIQVLDARAIQSSTNQELVNLAKDRILVNVALKSDLADLTDKKSNVYYFDVKQKNLSTEINKILKNALKSKIERYKAKGLVNPHFYVMIVGLPNIGKSSLINALAKKCRVQVENRPGVTRKVHLIKIDKNFSVYDTPGIFIKNIDSNQTGYILGLIGAIDEKVLSLMDVTEFATNYLFKHYEQQIRKYFSYDKEYNFFNFVNFVAQKNCFLLKKEELDLERTYKYLFKLYKENKIVKVDYEKEN